MHKRGAASLRTGTEKYWLIKYITLRDFTVSKGDKFMVYWVTVSDYSISLFTSSLKVKVPKWKQTLRAKYHIIKMVVYVQTFVQINILFHNYIKEYYLRSTGVSTQNNNTLSNVSPKNTCELPIIFHFLISVSWTLNYVLRNITEFIGVAVCRKK